jgi:hypothetical protein
MVVCAVRYEPVSGGNSPGNRETNREFRDSGPSSQFRCTIKLAHVGHPRAANVPLHQKSWHLDRIFEAAR